MKLKNLELRKTKTLSDTPREYFEIVRWSDSEEYCWTILSWITGNCLRFIGDRPFAEGVSKNDLWALMQYGQQLVDAEELLLRYKEDNK